MKPQRLLHWSLWIIIVGLILPLYLRIALDDPVDYWRGGIGAGDFKECYLAARLMLRGEDIYDSRLQADEMHRLGLPYDDLAYRQTAYVYPSVLATVLMPVALLPITEAARVWNMLNLALLIASLFLITRALDLNRDLGNYYPWFVILFAIAAPTTVALRIGQVNILILFFLVLAFYAYGHGKAWLAGAALALASLLKIFPGGLLLFFLWKKQYSVFVSGVCTFVAVIVINACFLMLTGRDATTDIRYLFHVLPNLNVPLVLDNQSLNGFFSRFELPPELLRLVIVTLSFCIAAITLIALSRSRPNDYEQGFALVLVALLLVSSFTWWSTLILLLIPFATLTKVWARQGYPRLLGVILILAYCLIISGRILSLISVSFLDSPWLIAFPFYGMLLLWGTLIWKIRYVATSAA